jgi:hypothetical protein
MNGKEILKLFKACMYNYKDEKEMNIKIVISMERRIVVKRENLMG